MKYCICSVAILSHHGDWPTSAPRVYRLNAPPFRLDVCDTSGSILQRLGLDDRGSNSAKSNKKSLGAAALWRLRYRVPSKGYSPVTQWRCVMVQSSDTVTLCHVSANGILTDDEANWHCAGVKTGRFDIRQIIQESHNRPRWAEWTGTASVMSNGRMTVKCERVNGYNINGMRAVVLWHTYIQSYIHTFIHTYIHTHNHTYIYRV